MTTEATAAMATRTGPIHAKIMLINYAIQMMHWCISSTNSWNNESFDGNIFPFRKQSPKQQRNNEEISAIALIIQYVVCWMKRNVFVSASSCSVSRRCRRRWAFLQMYSSNLVSHQENGLQNGISCAAHRNIPDRILMVWCASLYLAVIHHFYRPTILSVCVLACSITST